MKVAGKMLSAISTYVFIGTLLIIINACEPNVVFEKAMPPGIDGIDQVPEAFQGVYMCESDSSRIYADRYLIYQETFFKFITTIQQVKDTEDCQIVAGGLYLPGRKECIPFEYLSEDSITANVYDIDTLFSFADNEVLKLYMGRLFLNVQNTRTHWTTFMITPESDGSMLWEMIDIPDRVSKIEEITTIVSERQTDDNEVQYIINPTLVEFDRIIDKDYTMECDMLIPVNLEKAFKNY